MKCLIIDTPHDTHEIHMLNAKEKMEGFGGSRQGLLVGKTASLVVRTSSKKGGMVTDVENDISNMDVWAWIANMISDTTGTITARIPTIEEHKKIV